MKPKIIQVLPSISYGDAVSNQALNITNMLREEGYVSDIYAEHIDPQVKNIKEFKTLKTKITDNNILILHMAIGSDVNTVAASLPVKRKIMIYHNITPEKYLIGKPELRDLVRQGREQLYQMKNAFILALGVSEYNREELVSYGYTNTAVLPIIMDFADYNQNPDASILEKYNDGRNNIIFVGRVNPNKKQEDIIKSFYFYKNYCDKDARLFLVGSWQGMEAYYESLRLYVETLGLKDVCFTGHVKFEEMLSYYKIADLFLLMSEHEGFCVPLLESMFFEVPILAYKSSAIPYTLGRSGILFNEKNHRLIAEMMRLIISDQELKTSLIAKQKERLNDFNRDKIKTLLMQYINQVMTIN